MKMSLAFRGWTCLSVMAAALVVHGELVNLHTVITDAGLTASDYLDGGSAGTQYHASYPATKAFDGVTTSTSKNDRWLGEIRTNELGEVSFAAGTTYLTFTVPSDEKVSEALDGKVLRSYRLCRLSAGDLTDDRRPLQWKFYGVTAGGETNLLSDVNENVTWTGSVYTNDLSNISLKKGYTQFVIKPTYAVAMKTITIQNGWNVGLMEMELLFGLPERTVDVDVLDARYGDKVEIIGNVQDGVSYEGETITIKAVPADGNEFVCWEGLPDGVDNTATTSFVLEDKDVSIRLRTKSTWTYYPDAGAAAGEANLGVISNGVWMLNVLRPAGTETLVLGTSNTTTADHGGAYVLTNGVVVGSGSLDLRGRIVDADGKEWSITRLSNNCLGSTNSIGTTEILLPPTITALGGTIANINANARMKDSTLTNVVVDLPDYTGNLVTFLFNGQRVERAVVNAPKVQTVSRNLFSISDESGWSSRLCKDVDFGDWHFDAVTTIDGDPGKEGQMVKGFTKGRNLGTGTFHLPRVTRIAEGRLAYLGTTALEMGTAYTPESKATLTLAERAFDENTKLTNVVFGAYSSVTVDPKAFTNCTALTTVSFEAGMPVGVTDLLDALLTSVPEEKDGSFQTVIHASRYFKWGDLGEAATAEELANLPDGVKKGHVMGVYVTSDTKLRKALLVNRKSVYDLTGMMLIIR